MSRMKFVVCGEALIDLLPEPGGPGNRWQALAGGGPMNTAVALGKLGCDVHFLGRLGPDAFGRQIRRHLLDSGVQLDLAVAAPEPTSLAVVSLGVDGKAEYTFHFDNTSNFVWQAAEFPQLDADTWLHFGSVGAVVGSGAKAVCDFVAGTAATVSYDINVRPTVQPDRDRYFADVADLMAAVGSGAGIVKASDDDINWLVDDDEPVAYAQAWAAEYGLAMFIVTLGEHGAVAVKPDGRELRVPGRTVEVADTVGAGDTFMAGFLAQYLRDPADLELALTHGVAASALVCTRAGAVPPTTAELAEFLRD